jgi:acyl carrier protein
MWFFNKKSTPKSELEVAKPAAATVPTAGSEREVGRDVECGVIDMLLATVSRISRDHVPPESIDRHAHLLDSGYIDSLSSTELLADIERKYGVRIQEIDIVGKLSTLDALAKEIESRTRGPAK